MSYPSVKFQHEYSPGSRVKSDAIGVTKSRKNNGARKTPRQNLRLNAEIADQVARDNIVALLEHCFGGPGAGSQSQIAARAAKTLGLGTSTVERLLKKETSPKGALFIMLFSMVGQNLGLHICNAGDANREQFQRKLSGVRVD